MSCFCGSRRTFVFDIDGTLSFEGKPVSADIVRTLNDLLSDHVVAIASARHPVNIRDVIPEVVLKRSVVVGANGAMGADNNNKGFSDTLGAHVYRDVVNELISSRIPYIAYGLDFAILSDLPHDRHVSVRRDIPDMLRLGSDQDSDRVSKILALGPGEEVGVSHAIRNLSDVTVHRHSDLSFDISKPGTDKLHALARFGLYPPFFAAFGNDINDLKVFRNSQHSVCIGSNDTVCKIADLVIEGQEDREDRIVSAIWRLIEISRSERAP